MCPCISNSTYVLYALVLFFYWISYRRLPPSHNRDSRKVFQLHFSSLVNPTFKKIYEMNKEIPVCKILIVTCKIVVMCVHINPTCKKPQTEHQTYNIEERNKTVLYILFSFHNIKTFQIIFSRSLTVYILYYTFFYLSSSFNIFLF